MSDAITCVSCGTSLPDVLGAFDAFDRDWQLFGGAAVDGRPGWHCPSCVQAVKR